MSPRYDTEQRSVAEQIGRNLARGLERSPLSQDEIAKAAEMHRTHLRLIRRGERIPRLDTLVRIAGALDMDASELLRNVSWDATRQRFRIGDG